MRFPKAWAEIAKQNSVLKIAVIGVVVSSSIALLVSLKFAFKDPIIIERSCFSSISSATMKQDPTKGEIEGFIKEALASRFDTDASVQTDFISISELANRTQEQEEMKRRNVKQRIVVNTVTQKNSLYLVDADRLLSVGVLRSALAFPLTLKIEREERTQSNPYGLVLLNVSAATTEGNKSNDGK